MLKLPEFILLATSGTLACAVIAIAVPAHETGFRLPQSANAAAEFRDVGLHVINACIGGTSPGELACESPFSEARYSVPSEQVRFEADLARSVFLTQTGTGTAWGTSFLVGRDLVLTNWHILGFSDGRCHSLAVQLPDEQVACEEIIVCGNRPDMDYCLARMKPMRDGRALGDAYPILKLSASAPDKNLRTFLIGFVGDTQPALASSGTGTAMSDHLLFHRTPKNNGNSGSPIIGEDGVVYGVHFGKFGSEWHNENGALNLLLQNPSGHDAIRVSATRGNLPATWRSGSPRNGELATAVSSAFLVQKIRRDFRSVARELEIH